jgi:hypothetical protein
MSVERRTQVCYSVSFPVKMFVPLQETLERFEVRAISLSASALEVSCDDTVFDSLQSQQGFPYVCDLEFLIPQSEAPCTMPCHVLKFRRLSQRRYQIVLDFQQELPISASTLAGPV